MAQSRSASVRLPGCGWVSGALRGRFLPAASLILILILILILRGTYWIQAAAPLHTQSRFLVLPLPRPPQWAELGCEPGTDNRIWIGRLINPPRQTGRLTRNQQHGGFTNKGDSSPFLQETDKGPGVFPRSLWEPLEDA